MERPESVRDDLESRANAVGTCVDERRVGGSPPARRSEPTSRKPETSAHRLPAHVETRADRG